jgi:predicted DNA-binding transcriptional regulator YafY
VQSAKAKQRLYAQVKMYIPLPWIILLPYRLITLLMQVIFRKDPYTDRDKQVLKWLTKPDDPLRPEDYRIKHVDQLRIAIKDGKSVEIKYGGSTGPTSRKVYPERLFRRGQHIYVEAFCLTRRQDRIFRLDRIKYLRKS